MDINAESSLLIKSLAINLEKWKNENDISQRKLARVARVAESTIRSIIAGTTNIEIATLVKLKLAFSVEYSDLLYNNNRNEVPKVIPEPISFWDVKKAIAHEQIKIGENISKIMRNKNLSPEDLSILALNTDYSDTLKYLKGKVNLTLITILKFAHALEVEILELLDYK